MYKQSRPGGGEEGGAMSFTDQKPFAVTEEHTKARWGGCKNGKLTCGLCGHVFRVGEIARWQFASGQGCCNFFVCTLCDKGAEFNIAERKELFAQYETLASILGYDE